MSARFPKSNTHDAGLVPSGLTERNTHMLKTDPKVIALRKVGLFSGCSKRELKAVAGLCASTSMPEGSVLTVQGGRGRECYIIADGRALVTIDGTTVGEVGPGDCVGEMALLDGGPRTATVIAKTPVEAFVLSIPEFVSLLSLNPSISRKIAVGLTRRLRATEGQHSAETSPQPRAATAIAVPQP
jgi:CRP/FNR family transcriptional regulator, cyclic AMP receptor protein